MYKSFLRPLLFSFDPESVHHLFLACAKICKVSALRNIIRSFYRFDDERLKTKVFGIDFDNPVGLAAGFDKNCDVMEFFNSLGFGFAEIGTVTGQPQPGNARPRIVRLPRDAALINRMGFPSLGAEAVSQRLRALSRLNMRIGINIGKTKVVELDKALEDYLKSYSQLYPYGDFFVLNVSSPNTPELRKLQERPRLEALFRGIQAVNIDKKPLLVKIAPDLSMGEIEEIIECCMECAIDGIVATNTTFSRDGLSCATNEQGGLSGAPLYKKSLDIIRFIHLRTRGTLPIIAVGGIFTGEQVVEMIKAGASLVQIYTSLIYEGPSQVKRLKKELLEFLNKNSISNVKDLVGTA